MEPWIQLILGQGGALVVLIFVSVKGFKFLTAMIEKQEEKSEKQEQKSDAKNKRFDELHESTLHHIAAHTESVKNLTSKIDGQLDFCKIKVQD